MSRFQNALGQPIGAPLPSWQGCATIPHTAMSGRTCKVVPLEKKHAQDLYDAFQADKTGALWTYMPVGPFHSLADYAAWVDGACESRDPLFFAIIDNTDGKPVGVASYLRIQPEQGVVEVGYITFSPAMQRTVIATEAMYLMMQRVFDELGYRRYEWKCDALNGPSRRAAARLGFSYDGLFRQAVVYKGRNRDTAWFAVLDGEWPQIRAAFQRWLDPVNFDDKGQQRTALEMPTATRETDQV